MQIRSCFPEMFDFLMMDLPYIHIYIYIYISLSPSVVGKSITVHLLPDGALYFFDGYPAAKLVNGLYGC